jgi:DNA invertase Pin-like site-specific DNA recombinase
LGVSAFRSRNVTEGALGEFLAAVEAGRIPAGCVLIIESLDRISRNTVVDQFLLLLRIVKAGIELVTLMDEKHFTRESINASPLELIVSLAIMIRAHDESLQKSKRIAAAWRFKRQNAAKRKLTARCPPWLEIHQNRTEFITIKDRTFAVKEMFRLAVAGYSPQMIIAELERKRYEAWGKEKKWTLTKLLDVLQNRAVLGEFQTHKMEAGHRVPDGDVISDYFPTVIDVMDFERAKRALNFSPGARHGDANLFIGLAWDGQSGERMVKRNEYLTNESCDRGGPTHRWAYRAFEQNFLPQLIQLDWNVLPTNSHGPTEVIRLESQIADAKIRLDRAIQKVLAGDLAAKELAKEIWRIDVRITELQSKLDGARKGNSAMLHLKQPAMRPRLNYSNLQPQATRPHAYACG